MQDFGEKIGGARKDIWRKRNGLCESDLAIMGDAEQATYVNKDEIWPRPDYRQLSQNTDILVLYYRKRIRDALPAHPEQADARLRYVRFVRDIRGMAESVQDPNILPSVTEWLLREGYIRYLRSGRYETTGKLLGIRLSSRIVRIPFQPMALRQQADHDQFLQQRQKSYGKHKGGFPYPAIDHWQRSGQPVYRQRPASPEDFLSVLRIKGGEFGNWVSEERRHWDLDHAFDALMDLALVMGIDPSVVGFNGKLSIAFGARGCSRAAAHYEPTRKVINLTRQHGPGSLAHEWMHALDYELGTWCQCSSALSLSPAKAPSAFIRLQKTILFENPDYPDQGMSDYFKHAKKLDQACRKEGGYWADPTELFARAGAVWVKDRLVQRGIDDPYLTGNADPRAMQQSGRPVYISPQGQQRQRINEAFDDLSIQLLQEGFWHLS